LFSDILTIIIYTTYAGDTLVVIMLLFIYLFLTFVDI